MVQPILGEIRCFAGQRLPKNWALCEGQLLSINSFQQLFSVIGTTYGGDGRTTFALPDLRGRVVAGFGQGAGLTNRHVGQKLGQDIVGLTEREMPSHRHPMLAYNGQGNSLSPEGCVLADSGPNTVFYEEEHTGDQLRILSPGMTKTVGEGEGHENVMPVLAVNYMIAMEGTYPQKN